MINQLPVCLYYSKKIPIFTCTDTTSVWPKLADMFSSLSHPQFSIHSCFRISSSLRHAHLTPGTWGIPKSPVTACPLLPNFSELGLILLFLSCHFLSHHALINCHDFEYLIQVDDTYLHFHFQYFSEFQATIISHQVGLNGFSVSTRTSLNHFSIILFQRYICCSKSFNNYMPSYMNKITDPYNE